MLSRDERAQLLAKLDEYHAQVERHVTGLKSGTNHPDSWAQVMNAYAEYRTLIEHAIS